MEQRKSVTIKEVQPVNYELVTDENGVWILHGSPSCHNSPTCRTQLIKENGRVGREAQGYPSQLLAAAHQEYQKWVKEHPPGEYICEGWVLLPHPAYPATRKYAKGPHTDVYLDYNLEGPRRRIRIEQRQKSCGKSAPIEVVEALLRAEDLEPLAVMPAGGAGLDGCCYDSVTTGQMKLEKTTGVLTKILGY